MDSLKSIAKTIIEKLAGEVIAVTIIVCADLFFIYKMAEFRPSFGGYEFWLIIALSQAIVTGVLTSILKMLFLQPLLKMLDSYREHNRELRERLQGKDKKGE